MTNDEKKTKKKLKIKREIEQCKTDKIDKIDKTNKTNKTNKTDIIDINKNIIRQVGNYLNNKLHFNKLKGLIYYYIHLYIITIIGFISIFTTSVYVLVAVLIIVTLDAASIIFLHECPLTTMEKKYLGITSCEIRNAFLENSGIMYKCEHDYEKQIELLINIWTIIASKCISIIFLQMFNIQLFDMGKIYV